MHMIRKGQLTAARRLRPAEPVLFAGQLTVMLAMGLLRRDRGFATEPPNLVAVLERRADPECGGLSASPDRRSFGAPRLLVGDFVGIVEVVREVFSACR